MGGVLVRGCEDRVRNFGEGKRGVWSAAGAVSCGCRGAKLAMRCVLSGGGGGRPGVMGKGM